MTQVTIHYAPSLLDPVVVRNAAAREAQGWREYVRVVRLAEGDEFADWLKHLKLVLTYELESAFLNGRT